MALQRAAGNRAALRYIQRAIDAKAQSLERESSSSPSRWKKNLTWDVKAANGKGAFVTSGPGYQPGLFDSENNPLGYKEEDLQEDGRTPLKENRNFTNDKAWSTDESEDVILSKVKTAEDIDRLSMKEIRSINPQSRVPYNILHDVFHQSWHQAKHELAASDSPNRKAVMRKLWEYRQWHHNEVLKATQAIVNSDKSDPKGLDKWAAAGSTTLTSDIDVNLKGTHTEYAVKIYNKLFKQGIPGGHSWDVESGVAYDVNVYALDFMHAAFTFSDKSKTADGGRITGKEGARADQAQGGFTEEIIGKRDTGDQQIWSLVKMRLYMTPDQWDQYVADTEPSDDTLTQVELRYREYFDTLENRMIKDAGLPIAETKAMLSEAVKAEATGTKQIDKAAELLANMKDEGAGIDKETLAEQAKMGASNRVYEEKLEEIKETRLELEERIAKYNALFNAGSTGGAAAHGMTEIEILKGAVEMGLRRLRRLLSDAALFSNEAYLTDAAVNHAVVGIQSGMPLKQTKQESMIAVNENVADCLKEIARHGGGKGPEFLGEAAYKASKYYFRLADAARNMGLGKVAGVQTLYDAGYEISIELKGSGGANVEEDSAEAIRKHFGGSIQTPDQLVSKIIAVGTAVSIEFSKLGDKQELGQSMPSQKNARNPNE